MLARDGSLWREQCYQASAFVRSIHRRRELLGEDPTAGEQRFRELARALASGNGQPVSRLIELQTEVPDLKIQSNEKVRLRANWDPSYPGEQVRWYDEFIARHAPISTSWFEQPRNRESAEHEYLEVRGLAVYKEPGSRGSTLAVAPLDDGSICLWDVTGTIGRKGSIVSRSVSGILSVESEHQPGVRSKMISTGVTECISVDSTLKRAYIAVQSGMTCISYCLVSSSSYFKSHAPRCAFQVPNAQCWSDNRSNGMKCSWRLTSRRFQQLAIEGSPFRLQPCQKQATPCR